MSSLLKKTFDAAKCKTLLQLTSQRLKVLRNKQALVVKKARVDVAKLLEKGQDSNAKMQVESVFREEKIVALYELLDQFCQLVISRLQSIKSQKECPFDLKEAVASLIFAAPKCAELQELKQVSKQLKSKFGTDFSEAAKELRPDCGVNIQIIRSLSSCSPDFGAKLKMLKEIAAENNINWDYKMAMSDVSKGDTDLIDGPNHFASATELSEVGTHALADKQKSRSMHVNEVKGQASGSLQDAIGPHTMSAVASLGPLCHNVHQFANINTNMGAMGAGFSSRTQKVPDGVIHTPVLDPYALARAQGKMDYKVVSDYIGRAQASEGHLNSMELKQGSRGGVAYGEPATQFAKREQGHNALLDDASHREDALQRLQGKKAKKRHDVMVMLELKNAAESAATQAAIAATAAVDLVLMESLERSRGSEGNMLWEAHTNSSSGSVRDEHPIVAGMDFKHSANRDKFFYEDEVEMEPSRNNVMVDDDQVSEMNIHSPLDASEDSFKYVVFEQTSGLQKYTRSSMQAEGYNTNAEESYAFPTSYSRKNSDRIIFDAEPKESGSKEVRTHALFDSFYSDTMEEEELDKKSSFSDNQERDDYHTEVQQDKYVQNYVSVPQFDDYSSEEEDYMQKDLPVPQFDDNSRKEDDYMQKDLPVPQLDDHNSEDAIEEEEPFYLRGRAAMAATEDYAHRTGRASYGRKDLLMSTVSFSSDDEVEEESNTNMRSSEHEALGVSNDMEKLSIMGNSSGQKDVDEEPSQDGDYAEPVSLPMQSSKTPFRCQISTDSTGESSLTSPVAYNDRSGKLITRRMLKLQSEISEEWDLDSSYDKMASPLDSIKHQSLNEIGDPSNQVYRRKLNWLSAASEDSESMSLQSFESHTQRWNLSSFEDFKLESPKRSFNTEDFTRASTMDTTQVTQPSARKYYYGVSKRSLRSTGSRQIQEAPSLSSG